MLNSGRLWPYLQTSKARLERLAGTITYCSLQTFVNYASKKLDNIGHRALYYKTLQIRNLWQMGIFQSKIVSSQLSITTTSTWTNTLAYYGNCASVIFLLCRTQDNVTITVVKIFTEPAHLSRKET